MRITLAKMFMAALPLAAFFAFSPARAEIHWQSGRVSSPSKMEPAALGQALLDLAARPAERRAVIHFDGPLLPARRAALEASGVRVLSYLGGYAYFAALTPRLDAARAAWVSGLLAVEAIDPRNKLHPDLAAGVVHPWSRVAAGVAVYVLFHSDFDVESDAARVLERYGAAVASRIDALSGVVAHLPADHIAALAADPDVRWVEPPLPRLEEINDGARARTGVDVVNAPPYGLDGSGVTVLVYDGGKVFSHADLAGRLTIGQSDTGGTSDHATHVACTIGGDAVAGSLSGMAPGVQIVSYTFEQEGGLTQGFLYTDPGDLEADYGEAVSLYGADVANNSIGTNTAANGFPCDWEGNYGVTGALIDEVVRGALGDPFRVVWANGNERGAGTCGTTYQTTAPPACAKNSLTVGALNSNDDSVTSFTSWGPCDDGRLKPDVSAPGCQSGGDGGINSCSSSGGYTLKCGTSMACPVTTGIASLLLQQYRQSFPSRPDFRNSLLRSVLAQTAADLGNSGPDYQTGYGSIRAQPAVDLIKAERFLEEDVQQGETFVFTMNVGSASTVKVTLAWDDPAGAPEVNPVLVNDLDLRVVAPGGGTHHPWTLNPATPGAPAVQSVRDGVNNIEQVVITTPVPGTYIVQIEGVDIAQGPTQPISVATSHAPVLCAAAPTFGGLVSATAGASCGEINLVWGTGQSNCSPPGQISYNVYRGTTQLFVPQVPVHSGVGTTGMTDVGLQPGTKYWYIVRAEDSQSGEDGNSIKRSAIAPVSPDTGAPIFAGLGSATAGPSCREIILAWPQALETCSNPTSYEIHRSTSPGFIPGPGTRIATTFENAFVDTSVPPGTAHTYLVKAKDAAGNEDANNARQTATPTAFDVEIVKTGFEPDGGSWSVIAPNDAVTGNWQWGNPSGTAYQPEDDATPGSGVNCWITGLSTEPSNGDIDTGTTTLLSASYDATGTVDPAVTYSRWFTNDRGGSPGDATDSFKIDISGDDGQNWTPLEQIGAGTPLAWVPVSLPLPVAPTAQMRFRFQTADLGAGSLVEAGIDEFGLVDAGQACLQCGAPAATTLCTIAVAEDGDNVRIDWSGNPVTTRAVIYHVTGCGPSDRIKLGTTVGNFFVHEDALLSDEPFNYQVTAVDGCGNERPFCGTTDCP